jgi:hypothetical protein
MFSSGHNNNFFVRLTGLTSRQFAQWITLGNVKTKPTTWATFQSVTGETSSTNTDGGVMTDYIPGYAIYQFALAGGLSTPTVLALSATVLARTGLGATTPAAVGASDALAATINAVYGLTRTTLPRLT